MATAHHVYLARLTAGHADDPSEEAEAGGLLAAYDAHALRDLRDMFEGLMRGLAGKGD